ncbi:MAG: hypothetical protein ACRDZR_16820, partial [Acidimicrobiales bacterium]
MRLASFLPPSDGAAGHDPGGDPPPRTGVVEGDELVDLTDPAVGLPGDMAALLAGGPPAADRARAAP